MADAPHWTDIALVIIAVGAAVIAVIARGDSKRAVEEAAKARKIAQADFLIPHFDNVSCILQFIAAYQGIQSDQLNEKLAAYRESLHQLKTLLSRDEKLQAAINQLIDNPNIVDHEIRQYRHAISNNNDPRPMGSRPFLPAEVKGIIETIENKKHEYLSIG